MSTLVQSPTVDRKVTVDLGGTVAASVFNFNFSQDADRLFNRNAQLFATLARVTPWQFGWIDGVFNTASEQLRAVLADVKEMSSWGADPSNESDIRPRPEALMHALAWVTGLYYEVTRAGYHWMQPTVTVGPTGEAVLSWRNENRRLIVYISSDSAEFIQAWGPDIDTQMQEGAAESLDTRQKLWSWLVG